MRVARRRFVRPDRNRPRRPPAGDRARGAAAGPSGAGGAGRARLGPAGRPDRRGHVRRRRRGGQPQRRRHRRPAVERGAQAADPRQPQRAHRGAGPGRRRARRPGAAQRVGHRLLRRHRVPSGRRDRPERRRVPGRGLPRLGGGDRAGGRRRGARGAAALGRGARPGRRAARAGCGRCSGWPWAAGSAPVSSTCRGSRWTTRSARSASWPSTPRSAGRSTWPGRSWSRTPSSPGRWPRRSAGRRRSRCRRSRCAAVLGQMAEEMLLTGPRAEPATLLAAAYPFRHVTVADALPRRSRDGARGHRSAQQRLAAPTSVSESS